MEILLKYLEKNRYRKYGRYRKYRGNEYKEGEEMTNPLLDASSAAKRGFDWARYSLEYVCFGWSRTTSISKEA